MGYLHIDNLYKNQEILMFKECYALEKIHGTSAHISYKQDSVRLFSGGCKHSDFASLFDEDSLRGSMTGVGTEVVIYGEAYGGKLQGMRETYGDKLKFVAFDVKIGGLWLNVPAAEEFCHNCLIQFVSYERITTDLDQIDAQRDKHSLQAVRTGMGDGKMREGVVLRPIIEVRKNNGERIICKHKRDEFKETKTPRKVDPDKLKVLEDAREIAEEWVTSMRIVHVLDKIENPCMEKMREIITAMMDDVGREAEGEIVWSPEVKKAIGKATAIGVKEHFKSKLKEIA